MKTTTVFAIKMKPVAKEQSKTPCSYKKLRNLLKQQYAYVTFADNAKDWYYQTEQAHCTLGDALNSRTLTWD